MPESVAAAETLERIFTSNVLFSLEDVSVVTPVIIPLRWPLNVVVVPAPGIAILERATVTP